MTVTPLGKFLRKLRIDKDERLYDMAKNVGVSSAFLSGVENGHKKASNDLINKLINNYNLNDVQIEDLEHALEMSKSSLDLSDFSPEKQEIMIMLARKFDDLPSKDKKILTRLLSKGDDEDY